MAQTARKKSHILCACGHPLHEHIGGFGVCCAHDANGPDDECPCTEFRWRAYVSDQDDDLCVCGHPHSVHLGDSKICTALIEGGGEVNDHQCRCIAFRLAGDEASTMRAEAQQLPDRIDANDPVVHLALEKVADLYQSLDKMSEQLALARSALSMEAQAKARIEALNKAIYMLVTLNAKHVERDDWPHAGSQLWSESVRIAAKPYASSERERGNEA